MSQKFRYDINGLRAYAVVLVVLFHFGVLGFSAGFIGVDIFFVISGFLMTTIIINNLEREKFSILNFYLARGIRIVPALFVVCITVLILGWFFLLPTDYQALSKHSLSSINFFSNLIYWRESGYFDTDSHNKALLHTWSLSVEWQFYLIFPIIIALLYKLRPSRFFLASILIIGTVISLVLSIYITNKAPSAAFFLLPTRAWEMLAGGLIFFIPKEKISFSKPLEILGFVLIAISCYLFSINTLWPSYNAILPVIGTFLILLSNQQDSIFTRGKIFQWIGNNSYSIYLWHWPIVFALFYFYKQNEPTYIIVGLSLSFLLGGLSYKFIETPTRKYLSSLSQIKSYAIWIIAVGLLSIGSLIIYKLNGIESRFSKDIVSLSSVSNDVNPRKKECHSDSNLINSIQCTYGSGPVSLIVIGDSHADALLNGVVHSLPKNKALISYTISGCPTIAGIKRSNDSSFKCGEQVSNILNYLETHHKHTPVLIINRTNLLMNTDHNHQPLHYISKQHSALDKQYFSDIQTAYLKTIEQLSKGRQVYTVRSTPEAKENIPQLAAKIKLYNLDGENLKIKLSEYESQNIFSNKIQDAARDQYNVKIIDISKYFCDQKYCYFTKNGKPLFFDDNHMSWSSSAYLSPFFKEIFH